MPNRMLLDCMCFPKAVMACHAQRRSIVFAVHGYDVMPRLMSFDRVCCPKAMMSCHARRSPTVCAAQRR